MNHFKIEEFDCKETGENEMCPKFLDAIDQLRETCGFPFKITSGYRSRFHSLEASKAMVGTHAQGIAADIYCDYSPHRFIIMRNALRQGFRGIGIGKDFVHIDTRKTTPVMWVYS